MPFDVDLSVVNPLLDTVHDTFGMDTATDILLYAGQRVGAAAEEAVSPYPSPSGKPLAVFYTRQRKDGTTYQSKFKSLAQQRKVIMLGKEGKIPTKRTGTLGKSITSEATVIAAGVVDVRTGSNLSYVPYVIDREMQSHYHLGTWTPIQSDIEQSLPQFVVVAQRAVVKKVNERLGNG